VHGRALADPAAADPGGGAPSAERPLVRALGPDGRLVAVCSRVGGRLKPVRVLLGLADLLPEGGGAGRDR
jgi:hypothetical protein